MKHLLSCEFNFDTVCVKLKFPDGTMIAIDTIAVENEVTNLQKNGFLMNWVISLYAYVV